MSHDEPPSHHEMTVAAVGLVVLSLVLARNVDVSLLGLAFGAPVLLVARVVIMRREAKAYALRRLRTSWGVPDGRPRDLAALRRLYVACGGPERSAAALDDATWDDLDLDAVFAVLDRTLSAPGEYALYELLRTPSLDAEELAERERRIGAMESAPATRDALRHDLLSLDRSPIDPLTRLLFGDAPDDVPDAALLLVRALLPVAGIVLWAVFGGSLGPMISVAAVVSNGITHFNLKNDIAAAADGIRYLAVLVRVAGKIGSADASAPEAAGLTRLIEEISDVARAARSVASKGARIGLSDRSGGSDLLQSVYEYVAIFFLLEVRNYYGVLGQLTERRDDLRRLFRLVGEVDALQSVASWRSGLTVVCRPEFVDDAVSLDVTDAVHPLLAEPVANSYALNQGDSAARRSIVVTGSNMSGKSTFLRTIGLATILAQTLHTVPARRYAGSLLRVASSVTIRDDIGTGQSFYFAEAQRLLRLLRFAEEGGAALVLIDEPLRGTNSTERVAAVTEILLHLARQGALVVVATHELQIADNVARSYAACHLGDEIDTEGLRFPHRVLPGVATSRNAIRLLGELGYPADLVAAAEARSAAAEH